MFYIFISIEAKIVRTCNILSTYGGAKYINRLTDGSEGNAPDRNGSKRVQIREKHIFNNTVIFNYLY